MSYINQTKCDKCYKIMETIDSTYWVCMFKPQGQYQFVTKNAIHLCEDCMGKITIISRVSD